MLILKICNQIQRFLIKLKARHLVAPSPCHSLTLSPLWLSLLLVVTLTACAVPRPTIKIALVAPFEGRHRDLGYGVFPGFRETLQKQIKAGGVGHYQIEFVAYNDSGDPAYAERIAHNVVIDPQVVLVIGHLRADSTLAALPVYTEANLPLLAMGLAPNTLPASHPLAFAASGNIETVTQHAINAIAQDLRSNPKPTRQGVAKALANN